MPLGDWATWVQSIATVGALIAAVVAALVAQRVYRVESERDERAAEDRRVRADAERRAQADKVAAWYAWADLELGVSGWAAVVRNSSDLPIYDLDVDFWYQDHGAGTVPSRAGAAEETVRVVPPQDQVSVAARKQIIGEDGTRRRNHVVAIEFRDAAGARWRRDIHGKLTGLDRPDSAAASAQNGVASAGHGWRSQWGWLGVAGAVGLGLVELLADHSVAGAITAFTVAGFGAGALVVLIMARVMSVAAGAGASSRTAGLGGK